MAVVETWPAASVDFRTGQYNMDHVLTVTVRANTLQSLDKMK